MREPWPPQPTELRIPASREYVGLARRLAATLATGLGFDPEDADELAMAVGQVCGNVCDAAAAAWGGGATLKVSLSPGQYGLSVDVEALAPGSPEALPVQKIRRATPHLRQPASSEVAPALLWEVVRACVDDLESWVDGEGPKIHCRMVKYLIPKTGGER